MRTNLSITKKLLICTIGTLVILCSVMLGAHYYTRHVASTALDAVAVYQGRITMAVEWRGKIDSVSQRLIAQSVSDEPELVNVFASGLAKAKSDIADLLKNIQAGEASPEEKSAIEAVMAIRKKTLLTSQEIEAAKAKHDIASARKIVDEKLLPYQREYQVQLGNYIETERNLRDRSLKSGEEATQTADKLSLCIVALVLVAGAFFILSIVRAMSNALDQAVELSLAISNGDLTRNIKIDRDDEIGRLLTAMQMMTERLRHLVEEVRLGVAQVTTASSEIAAGSLDLSIRTEEQASSLQQAASSMEEMTMAVRKSAADSRSAAESANGARIVASKGGEIVGNVVKTMGEITQSSKQIYDIIGVIEGIAFQTNILALNAAVEAARAGEQGRGFAVVASEVRLLARRSAEAAKQIKSLIEQSVNKVDLGASLVSSAGETMRELVASVTNVCELVEGISAAGDGQSRGILKVSESVTQIDQVTQQNAALVEESAAAAESLKIQAVNLSTVVSTFVVGNE